MRFVAKILLSLPLLTVVMALYEPEGTTKFFRRTRLSANPRMNAPLQSYLVRQPSNPNLKTELGVIHRVRGGSNTKGDVVPAAAETFWDGESGIIGLVINIVNNIAGAGILTLAGGLAAGSGIVPAIVISTLLCAICGYTFTLVGRSCFKLKEKTFKGLWSKTLGKKSAWILDAGICFLCFNVLIIYSGILGDVFTSLFYAWGVPPSLNSRKANILIIALTMLLPLSLLKSLSILAYTSFLGLLSVIYTVYFVLIRCIDGSYRSSSSAVGADPPGLLLSLIGYNSNLGKFIDVPTGPGGVADLLAAPMVELIPADYRPLFDSRTLNQINFKVFVLVANLGLAFLAHYNAPRYFSSLLHPTPNRFSVTIALSFTILHLFYLSVMVAGYLTFGSNAASNILLNYHPKDGLASGGRLATGLSILFGYPLVFMGFRQSLEGLARSLLDLRKGVADESNAEPQQQTPEKALGRVGAGVAAVGHILKGRGMGGGAHNRPVDLDSTETDAASSLTPDDPSLTFVDRLLLTPTIEARRSYCIIFFLAVATVISCLVEDIGLIAGITGALMGSCVCYIVPPLVHVGTKKYEYKQAGQGRISMATRSHLALVPWGIFLATLGIYNTLAKKKH